MTRRQDPRPIGVFDSGVGGLTVLDELRRRLPDEPTIYLGDNARAPYGPRPADEVRRFTHEAVDWLLARDVKLLVLACNTATARALPDVRMQAGGVPVIGVVRPGALAAASATRTRRIGVIATAGTVESGAERAGRALQSVQYSRLVAVGLQTSEHPRAGIGQRLVIEIDGILRGHGQPQAECARLLQDCQQRRFRGRIRDRRQEADDLVEIDDRPQAGGAALAAHPADNLVQ